MMNQESPKKSISEQLQAILIRLSTDQIRFVVARQEYLTIREAAEAIGIKPDTVYHWPDEVKEAVRLMAADGLVVAQHIRRRSLAKAMQVKVTGLNSDDERVRQGVATEVIEWEMGKATQRQEIAGVGGGAIELHFKNALKRAYSDDSIEPVSGNGSGSKVPV